MAGVLSRPGAAGGGRRCQPGARAGRVVKVVDVVEVVTEPVLDESARDRQPGGRADLPRRHDLPVLLAGEPAGLGDLRLPGPQLRASRNLAVNPTMSEFGNGHGWSPRYSTSWTCRPTSSWTSRATGRREALPWFEETRQHREPARAPSRAPRASSSRSSVVDDRHDDRHVGARVVLTAARGQRRSQPAWIGSVAVPQRGQCRGWRASSPGPAPWRRSWHPRSDRSAPTWRRPRSGPRRRRASPRPRAPAGHGQVCRAVAVLPQVEDQPPRISRHRSPQVERRSPSPRERPRRRARPAPPGPCRHGPPGRGSTGRRAGWIRSGTGRSSACRSRPGRASARFGRVSVRRPTPPP